MRSLVFAACGVLLLVAGCAGGGEPGARDDTASPTTASAPAPSPTNTPFVVPPTEIQAEFTLADGVDWVAGFNQDFNSIRTMTGDPRSGVWVWSASATSSQVQFSDAGTRQLIELGGNDDLRIAQSQPVLTACQDAAWLGINDNLVELTRDGTGTPFRVPSAIPVPDVDAQPSDLTGLGAITGLDCQPDGVLVTVANPADWLLFRTATHGFEPAGEAQPAPEPGGGGIFTSGEVAQIGPDRDGGTVTADPGGTVWYRDANGVRAAVQLGLAPCLPVSHEPPRLDGPRPEPTPESTCADGQGPVGGDVLALDGAGTIYAAQDRYVLAAPRPSS